MTASPAWVESGSAAAPQHEPAQGGPRPSVLVVEDDADMLELLTEALRFSLPGWDVRGSPNAQDALACPEWRSASLVVSDYLMPGKNGLEMARSMRAEGSRVPIVLVTAFVDTNLEKEVAASGLVQSFLRKPVEPAALVAEIRRLVPLAEGAPAPA